MLLAERERRDGRELLRTRSSVTAIHHTRAGQDAVCRCTPAQQGSTVTSAASCGFILGLGSSELNMQEVQWPFKFRDQGKQLITTNSASELFLMTSQNTLAM